MSDDDRDPLAEIEARWLDIAPPYDEHLVAALQVDVLTLVQVVRKLAADPTEQELQAAIAAIEAPRGDWSDHPAVIAVEAFMVARRHAS